MGNIFATTITAIALTAGYIDDANLLKDDSSVIITKFELDLNRKIVNFSDPVANSYWTGLKSNGDVDLTNMKFIPVKYNTFNMLFPAYIPEFLLMKPVNQDGVYLLPIEIKIGNEYTLFLTCSNYDESILKSME